jgi:assimilatory nitrate reductase catalytic subunit
MSPRLCAHSPQPFIEIHPDDAQAAGLADGGLAKVTTQYGSATLKVFCHAGQQRGSIFAPIHWSNSTAAQARVGDLVAATPDPISGQPELKATPARVEPAEFAYRGFALTRHSMTLPEGTWFARLAVVGGVGVLFATNEPPTVWHDLVRQLLPEDAELAAYSDQSRGVERFGLFRSGRFDGCLFVGPAHRPPQWEVARSLFESGAVAAPARRIVFAGRRADAVAEAGPLICACFGVRLAAIRDAMAASNATSVADIGRTLRAGTNCGSCLPELRDIVERVVQSV